MGKLNYIFKAFFATRFYLFFIGILVISHANAQGPPSATFSIDNFEIERASFGFFEGVDGSINQVNEGTEGAILDRAYLCDEVWVRFELSCQKDSISDFTIELTKIANEQAGRLQLPDFIGISINGSFTGCSINEQRNQLDYYNKSGYNTFDCLNGNGLQLMKGDKINVEFISWFEPILNLVKPDDWQAERLGLNIITEAEISQSETSILVKSPVFKFENFGDANCSKGCGKVLSVECFKPDDFGDERRLDFPQIDWIEFTESLPLSWQEYELRGIFNRDHNFYDLPNQGFVVEYDQDDIWYWDGKPILGSVWVKHKGGNSLKNSQITISGSFDFTENSPVLFCQNQTEIVSSLKPTPLQKVEVDLVYNHEDKIVINQKNQTINGVIRNPNPNDLKPFCLYINNENSVITDFKFNNKSSKIYPINDNWVMVTCPAIERGDSLITQFNISVLQKDSVELIWLSFTDETKPTSLLKSKEELVNKMYKSSAVSIDSLVCQNPLIDFEITKSNGKSTAVLNNLQSAVYNPVLYFEIEDLQKPSLFNFEVLVNDSLVAIIPSSALNSKQFIDGKRIDYLAVNNFWTLPNFDLKANDQLKISWPFKFGNDELKLITLDFETNNYRLLTILSNGKMQYIKEF